MNVETQYAAAVTTQSIAYHQHSGLANEDINHRSLKQRVDIQYHQGWQPTNDVDVGGKHQRRKLSEAVCPVPQVVLCLNHEGRNAASYQIWTKSDLSGSLLMIKEMLHSCL